MLWFDVGFKRYTTMRCLHQAGAGLWFDVGFKRYTTWIATPKHIDSCGLM